MWMFDNILLFFSGQLYGLEKFWAFLKYYKYAHKVKVCPKIQEFLKKFNTVDDFREKYVSFFSLDPMTVSQLQLLLMKPFRGSASPPSKNRNKARFPIDL